MPEMGSQFRLTPNEQDEGPKQIHLVLHLLQTPHRAKDVELRIVERRPRNRCPLEPSRHKARQIHTIADPGHAPSGNPDGVTQIGLKMSGERDVVGHKRTMQATDQAIGRVGPVRIGNVPAVLAVNPHGNACQPGRQSRLKRSQIAGMNNIRAILAKQAKERRKQSDAVPGGFVQCDKFYIRAAYSGAEHRVTFCQSHDHVPKAAHIKTIDQIDHAILQPADGEAEYHVHHEETPILA